MYAGSVGLQGSRDRLGWRAGGSTGYQTLGRQPYRRTNGAFAEGSFKWSESDACVLGVQRGRFVYQGSNAVRNASFDSATAGWRHLFASAWRPELDATVNWGRELSVFDDRQDLSRDLRGGRVALGATPFARWTVGMGLAYQRSAYREPDAVLETARDDRYLAVDASLTWALADGLQLRAELSSVHNESNIALYEYRRRAALLRLRYEIR